MSKINAKLRNDRSQVFAWLPLIGSYRATVPLPCFLHHALDLPATGRCRQSQRYNQTVPLGLPRVSAAMTGCGDSTAGKELIRHCRRQALASLDALRAALPWPQGDDLRSKLL
jgi:hypothetical protein